MTEIAPDAQENQTTHGEQSSGFTVRMHREMHDINLFSLLDVLSDTERPPKINGDGEKDAVDGEEPPSKRLRFDETTPKRNTKIKVQDKSPPWKKIEAEGLTTFIQDGKRRSGRVNEVPMALQPPSDKRQTRGGNSTRASRTTSGSNASQARDIPASVTTGSKKSAASSQQPPVKAAPSPKRSYHRKSMPVEQSSTPKRSHKKKTPAPPEPQSDPVHTRVSKSKRLRSADTTQDGDVGRPALPNLALVSGQSPKGKLSRIKFRVKQAELPLTNPGLVIRRPKRYATLREFLEKESNVPVEEGGLFTPDDANEYTAASVSRDAQLLIRLEDAAAPGGVLSPGVCSAYQPEEQEQPPQQYAHRDHLNRAAIEFRRLMVMEERKHRQAAKRLAEACRDEWHRRQPKTSEQLEADERKAALGRYKYLVKTIQGTWDNVKAEVNRRRLVEWEAQEKERVRKALNEAVDISTQKLEARRVRRDSEIPSVEDDEEETDVSDDEDEDDSDVESAQDNDGEENMSSSESERDEDETLRPDAIEDEHLSVEQLRLKYSSLPDLPLASNDIEMTDVNDNDHHEQEPLEESPALGDTFDDSDESIDMDDDMGSSDEDRDSDEESGDNEEEDEDDANDHGESSLLGFLAPTDLESLKAISEEVSPESGGAPQLEDGEDDDEVQLVPVEEEAEPSRTNGHSDDPEILGEGAESSSFVSKVPKQVLEVVATSPDRSTFTPRTTETKPSEIDSASSIDHHSRQVTHSATPQPTNGLKTPVPFLLRGTLREYQHYGLDWLAGLYANNTNGILADEMGLGKTIQTIALLAHLACEHEIWGPHLVIVPTSVMLNWEMEFKKFLPGFKILTYYGTQEERKRKRHGWRDDNSWNVIITSYQLVLQDRQVFKHRRWHYMILDEAHNIKNFQSQRWQAMLTFNTRARLLLTGTPLQNNLTELWSLLYFLMPSDGSEQGVGSGFADLKEFHGWFEKPTKDILEHGREHMNDEAREIISKLHTVLRPYLLRRLKADVEKQMPGKFEHVLWCRLSKRQRELYDGFLNRDDTRGTLASGNYLSIINCLMQLRKVCNHPDLFIERAIMTSFPMNKSAVSDFEIKDLLVRRRLLREDPMTNVSLDFLNLVPTKHESLSKIIAAKVHLLSAQKALMDAREAQRTRAQNAFTNLDPSTVKSNLVYLESASRWGRFEELQHCVYLNALRRQQTPTYGSGLIELLTLGVNERPMRPRPKRRSDMLLWLENSSPTLSSMIPTISSRSHDLKSTIQKFACVTPSVTARDMTYLTLTPKAVNAFQSSVSSEVDPFHEARMRLSIQFPDKRLLQYDCGKLQTLAKLLRKLQAQGSRALIFTQMTKVLDILEQFLNIHGHKYLRLDGSTKVEQRQALTDRFNNDNRILVFILSSRSGGLGINLTGADTVIFYDLDWNPAMDKQCQDRAHRIGQTRDVHIYRLVSEHTIEANILRKANQKRMLDDVVIQEGEFTTDHFNKVAARELGEEPEVAEDDAAAAANAAMDRVLGGSDNTKDVSRVLAHVEDKEDVVAASIAEREIVQTDAADFDENAATTTTPAGTGTPQEITPPDDLMEIDDPDDPDELNAWGQRVKSMDDYMLNFMTEQLRDAPVELPKDKIRSKRGKDRRRAQRVR
jgi:helicase SWR1